VEALKEEIKLLGYHDDVLEDEAHAFSVDSGRDLEAEIPEELSAELQKIYKKYL
jgi:hypothetical protein